MIYIKEKVNQSSNQDWSSLPESRHFYKHFIVLILYIYVHLEVERCKHEQSLFRSLYLKNLKMKKGEHALLQPKYCQMITTTKTWTTTLALSFYMNSLILLIYFFSEHCVALRTTLHLKFSTRKDIALRWMSGHWDVFCKLPVIKCFY